MWSLIDRERMYLAHRHPSLECLNNIDYIETWGTHTVIIEDTHAASFRSFTDYELKMLHENLCGKKFEGFNYEALLQAVAALIQQAPMTDALLSESIAQANAIPLSHKREGSYRYLKGSAKPEELEDLFRPEPKVAVVGYVPTLKLNHIEKVRTQHNVDIKPNPTVTAMMDGATSTPSAPRASRAPSEPGAAPTKGTTKMVWDIAERLHIENPSLSKKELSKLVAVECEQTGINPSTRSVQYSKWASTKNL